ncbi:concanavalin A-like lectin/glucanase [Mycena haematopus]|nr:concanavalin A-like lectin/glucanase [Mycena haematopus]
MFALAKLSVLLVFVPFIAASPTPDGVSVAGVTIDTSSHCGQYDLVVLHGTYTLLLDQWGMASATSGSNCAAIASLSGSTVAWSSTWTWNGGYDVKSFNNMNLNNGLNKQLSAIQSIPTTWSWTQNAKGPVISDVSYDLFTSATAGGAGANEVMIWMASFNAAPISTARDSAGHPSPIATNIVLAGHTWNLFLGPNGKQMNVYSFLPTSGTITSFSADINVFLKWLTANQPLSASQYLITAQAGTEAISGSAQFITSAYSLVVN